MEGPGPLSRRSFLGIAGGGVAALELAPWYATTSPYGSMTADPTPNMIGAYGPWAAELAPDPPELSFRRASRNDLESWRKAARERLRSRLAMPPAGERPEVTVRSVHTFDGLHVEELSWQLPYGPPTGALLLKPEGATGRLPGVLAFHDHGGNKFFGLEKITRTGRPIHEMMVDHQNQLYEGTAWANELARRGYVVLVPDAFALGSRRVRVEDVPDQIRRNAPVGELATRAEIEAYNRWAGEHEHIMSKSLLCAGTTWPGVFVAEDQVALDVLCSREDVDAERVGCGGLSGGGLRTVMLGGLDARIRCAVCVGMMSTWNDYLLNTSWTHTWMVYVPLLPRELDYPEILGLRVPLPTLVQSNNEDPLFTLPEMHRADRILSEVFARAGAPESYRGSFYPGRHKFDAAMQLEAFAWFDRWM